MSAGHFIQRELRVALSRRAQSLRFRLIKWLVIIGLIAMFWRAPLFWWCLLGAIVLALVGHFTWRWKTRGWTQPWGGWDDVETAGKRE